MLRRSFTKFELPSHAFNRFVQMGTLRDDPRQREALIHIDRLYNDVENYVLAPKPRDLTVPAPTRNNFTNIGYVRAEAAKSFLKDQGVIDAVHPLSKIPGLYLYGGVGSGKTALMDIFFNEIPVSKKQRVHFHQFMLDVHKLHHKIRQSHSTGAVDGEMIMRELAIKIAHNAELLCFDELVVADIVDAMILKRLFHNLYAVGICCIFTSNRPPQDLYMGGLNRESFLPFIRLLDSKCVVHDMQSDTDYRLTGRQTQTYFAPMNDDNCENFNKLFLDLTNQRIPEEKVLRVFGRDVVAPRTVGGVSYFTYHELCSEDRSAADYGVLAKVFHTIFIEGVPRFGPQDSDSRRRFIALIDELYQRRVKVILLAETELEQLAEADDEAHLVDIEGDLDPELLEGVQKSMLTAMDVMKSKEETLYAGQLMHGGEDSFQMKRCISRLQEMRTHEYLESKFGGPGEVDLLEGAPL